MEIPHDVVRSTGPLDTADALPALPCVSWIWPVGCVLTVLYASLLPFDFTFAAFRRAVYDGLGGLRFRSTTPNDAVTNLLVYLPLGLVLGLYAMRSRFGRWTGALLAVVIATTLSILVETLQIGLASRVASCTDILLNGMGAAIGACLGVCLSGHAGAVASQVRRELATHPFSTSASLLTMGLFLYNLLPFDFVMNTGDLHDSFGRAHWSLWGDRVTTIGAPPFAAIAHQLTGAAWFAVLGYLLALGGRERERHPVRSLGAALKDGFILGALIEFMQLFTRSHTFDAGTILIRCVGVVFGAWCAVFMIDSLTRSAWRHRPSLALPTGILAILAVFQIGLLMAPCVNPQGWFLAGERSITVQWLPFENLWRQSFHTAAAEVAGVSMTFGALALTLGVLMRRLRLVHAGSWAFWALTLTAIACQGLRFATLGKPLDVTTLLLALIATYLAAGLVPQVAVRKAASPAGSKL